MSASKDKIYRREQRAAGIVDKKEAARAEEAAKARKHTITYGVVALVIVLLVAFVFIYNSALPSRSFTAVTIGDEDYSVAEMNYYYSNTYQNFYSTYAQYIQYGMMFDTSAGLDNQTYSEEQTWREYFLDVSIDDMKQIQVLCDAAKDAGFTTLPEEYQAQYDAACASLETSWESNGYSSLTQFINLVYGKGVDFELVKSEMYRSMLAAPMPRRSMTAMNTAPRSSPTTMPKTPASWTISPTATTSSATARTRRSPPRSRPTSCWPPLTARTAIPSTPMCRKTTTPRHTAP